MPPPKKNGSHPNRMPRDVEQYPDPGPDRVYNTAGEQVIFPPANSPESPGYDPTIPDEDEMFYDRTSRTMQGDYGAPGRTGYQDFSYDDYGYDPQAPNRPQHGDGEQLMLNAISPRNIDRIREVKEAIDRLMQADSRSAAKKKSAPSKGKAKGKAKARK
jgi:hypothetical protein